NPSANTIIQRTHANALTAQLRSAHATRFFLAAGQRKDGLAARDHHAGGCRRALSRLRGRRGRERRQGFSRVRARHRALFGVVVLSVQNLAV
ncbi:hypothetical protein, partial [Klebsiella aerogenes]|uniref:hypothetical protein n=1 Tax=Klebsiella aerogenes TaxID=548 RepID=UPI0013DDC724